MTQQPLDVVEVLGAAAEFEGVAVGVADEDRDVTVAAEHDRTLGDLDVLFLQHGDGVLDGADPQRHMGEAGIFDFLIHQNVFAAVGGGCVDN